MSRFRKFEIVEPIPSFFLQETSIFAPKPFATLNPSFSFQDEELEFGLDLLNPNPDDYDLLLAYPFHGFDLVELNKPLFYSPTQLVQRRVKTQLGTEFYLQSLCDRVSALEDRLLAKPKWPAKVDQKYTWTTTEINNPEKDGLDRKYKLTEEIKGGKKEEKSSYKWSTEIKGKGERSAVDRKYIFEGSTENAGGDKMKK